METSSPAAFVNGDLLKRYIGQKVKTVVQVIRSDIGSVIGKSTDDQQIVIKVSPNQPLTTYLEVIGIAETDNTILFELKFGPTLEIVLMHKTITNCVSLQMVSLDTCSSKLQGAHTWL